MTEYEPVATSYLKIAPHPPMLPQLKAPPDEAAPYRLPSEMAISPTGFWPSAQLAAEQNRCTILKPVPVLLMRKRTQPVWLPPYSIVPYKLPSEASAKNP